MRNKKEKFLWGVVNIGSQTEGGQLHSDWLRWSQRGVVSEIGISNDYWNRFSKDHEIAQSIGCNALRITIEWSRVEPQEGKFDKDVIEWYRKILQNIRECDMQVVVGLWHWSVPEWFEDRYGIHKKESVKKFELFVRYVRNELGDMIDYVVILNEPNVFVSTSYILGERPPFFRDLVKAFCAKRNLVKMHCSAYHIWKEKYSSVPVGTAFLWNHEFSAHNTFLQKGYLFFKKQCLMWWWIDKILNYSDYLGINYYTSDGLFFGKSGGRFGMHGINNWNDPDVWKIFPKGLYHVLMQVDKYKKPIYILENGKPTVTGIDDWDRQKFLVQSINYMKKAIAEGVNVKGYFHYSLCDSYEWTSGYDFKFGLVEIDRETLKRKQRKSCDIYKKIIRENEK
ncbi:MAG: hypothetical protein CR972_01000 [Candidatus Moraniibacteriota bacterium]|nr:MAG: hypothetical protein CR972_01000 [Candidatus Moranbacteria bacterium]